jgi:hypothetical protein
MNRPCEVPVNLAIELNRYHAYWTLAQFNASWATTRIVVLHIAPTTS